MLKSTRHLVEKKTWVETGTLWLSLMLNLQRRSFFLQQVQSSIIGCGDLCNTSLVAESLCDLFQRFSSCLDEETVHHEPEAGHASNKNVVLVLMNGSERLRSSLCDADVNNEVGCTGDAHDLRANSGRQDLGSVQPGSAVDHRIVGNDEKVDTENCKTFSHTIVSVLELT